MNQNLELRQLKENRPEAGLLFYLRCLTASKKELAKTFLIAK